MSFIRRVLVTTAVVIGLTSLTTGLVAPASAADRPGECTSYTRWDNLWGQNRYTAWYPTTRYGSWNTGCTLQRGDSGSGVRLLQQVLNACYGMRLAEDGIFGYATEWAVEEVALEEVGNHWDEYTDVLRREMDWKYWRYDDRGAHWVCRDNSLVG
jgi:hypothetical protein